MREHANAKVNRGQRSSNKEFLLVSYEMALCAAKQADNSALFMHKCNQAEAATKANLPLSEHPEIVQVRRTV